MMRSDLKKWPNFILLIIASIICTDAIAQSNNDSHDTLLVPIIVYNGDTMTYRELDYVIVSAIMTEAQREAFRKWTRLRNAVYVTYPFARQASLIINEINVNLGYIKEKNQRKTYIKSKEAELKKKFTDPLTNLSVYQGKVLMKLINRETNNTCYELIKEYKGGFTARFWQTIAWVFGSSLKQDYDPFGTDAELESIAREVARMYGRS
jgi:Domain of unknown function (DUF4294)